jgi:basic membrane protein A
MNMMKPLFGLTLALCAGMASAEPALVFDLGGKFDRHSTRQPSTARSAGPRRPAAAIREIEMQSEAQREQALRRLAEAGSNPIVMAGFSQATPLSGGGAGLSRHLLRHHRRVVDQPNVRSVIFSEHEGSYLVGMMAAMASETGTVGFVGGMDIPLISEIRLRLCPGRRRGEPRHHRDRQHDRHHAGGLERPGARR